LELLFFFEIENVDSNFFNKAQIFETLMNEICTIVKATIVKKCGHIFDNNGTTICYILAESSLIIHTWPEYNSFTIDLFMCSDSIDVEKINKSINKNLEHPKIKYKMIDRKIKEK
jgi:S-adenosylmethionine decarboxylase proenzyme